MGPLGETVSTYYQFPAGHTIPSTWSPLADIPDTPGTFQAALAEFLEAFEGSGVPEPAFQARFIYIAGTLIRRIKSTGPHRSLRADQPNSLKTLGVVDGVSYPDSFVSCHHVKRSPADSAEFGDRMPRGASEGKSTVLVHSLTHLSLSHSDSLSARFGSSAPDFWYLLDVYIGDRYHGLAPILGEMKIFQPTLRWRSTIAVRQAQAAWYHAILYCSAAHEICRTWLGMSIVNERVSRLCVMDQRPRSDGGESATIVEIAIEVPYDEIGRASHMSVTDFLNDPELPTKFAHRLCQLNDNGFPLRNEDNNFVVSDNAITTLYRTLATSLHLMSDIPWNQPSTASRNLPPSSKRSVIRSSTVR